MRLNAEDVPRDRILRNTICDLVGCVGRRNRICAQRICDVTVDDLR